MKYLVTGAAGFIGSNICEKLLGCGNEVVGIDCFTDYYKKAIKENNLKKSFDYKKFEFIEKNILLVDIIKIIENVDVIIHLAAQAGVRSSWGEDFSVYVDNNILSTQKILEAAKNNKNIKIVYASSSSVYGDTTDLPMKENSICVPVSPYGVTKLAAENMCYLYNKNFNINAVSLRYFTVYGPKQRPDMAFNRFIKSIIRGKEIKLFGSGEQSRDFTYVEDITDATISAAVANNIGGQIINIGGCKMVSINSVISVMEEIIGKRAIINKMETAKGDVMLTMADCSLAEKAINYKAKTDLAIGIKKQIEWQIRNY